MRINTPRESVFVVVDVLCVSQIAGSDIGVF